MAKIIMEIWDDEDGDIQMSCTSDPHFNVPGVKNTDAQEIVLGFIGRTLDNAESVSQLDADGKSIL